MDVCCLSILVASPFFYDADPQKMAGRLEPVNVVVSVVVYPSTFLDAYNPVSLKKNTNEKQRSLSSF
jgi:hypothetical protein